TISPVSTTRTPTPSRSAGRALRKRPESRSTYTSTAAWPGAASEAPTPDPSTPGTARRLASCTARARRAAASQVGSTRHHGRRAGEAAEPARPRQVAAARRADQAHSESVQHVLDRVGEGGGGASREEQPHRARRRRVVDDERPRVAARAEPARRDADLVGEARDPLPPAARAAVAHEERGVDGRHGPGGEAARP